ncbi:MAG: adenosylcobinamide amidohydrolase [Paracoccaceae bacterium]
MRVLSWAPHGAGYTPADAILWREVKNADLTPEFDAEGWLAAQMPQGAVGMLTSRDVGTFHESFAEVEGVTAHCLATVGLSNGESIGRRLPYHSADYGTINIGLVTNAALTEAAQLEAMSIVVQARTVGVMAAGVSLATGLATGTGTDCVALACLPGQGRYAGLHTAVGEAVGAAVRDCLTRASQAWVLWRDAERARRGVT